MYSVFMYATTMYMYIAESIRLRMGIIMDIGERRAAYGQAVVSDFDLV